MHAGPAIPVGWCRREYAIQGDAVVISEKRIASFYAHCLDKDPIGSLLLLLVTNFIKSYFRKLFI